MAEETIASETERRTQARASSEERWQTALTSIEPNSILIRGYPRRRDDGASLVRRSRLPAADGRAAAADDRPDAERGARVVARSRRDAASTLAARNVATSGAPLKDCVAAGILAFGRITAATSSRACGFSTPGSTLMRGGKSMQQAAEALVDDCLTRRQTPPGFGHRFHTRDPRAARLFQMALELELEGEHVRMIRVDRTRARRPRSEQFGRPLPVNVDGAIAAICGRPGIRLRARQRDLPDLAAARPDRARARRTRPPVADAPDRSQRPRLRRVRGSAAA